MDHLYRIIAHLTDKGLDYTVVEFDVKSVTADNYIVFDDIGGNKTKRVPKASLLRPSASDFGFDAFGKTWVMKDDIEQGKQVVKEAIEKTCDAKIAYAEKMKEAFTTRKNDIGKVWRSLERRWDG